MKIYRILLLTIVAVIFNAHFVIAQVQSTSAKPINAVELVSLIPMNKREALRRMTNALDSMKLNYVLDAKTLTENLSSGDGGYAYSGENSDLIFTLNGLTGEILFMRHVFTEADADGDIGVGKPGSRVQGVKPTNADQWLEYLKNHGVDVSLLKFSWYSENNKFSTLTLAQDEKFVDFDGLEIASYFDVSKLNNEFYLANIENIIEQRDVVPTITFDQAVDLANWLMQANAHTLLRAPSQFNAKQKQFWNPLLPRMAEYTAYKFYAPPRVEVRRDKWLMLHPEWHLNFGHFSVRLNAETGHPLTDSYKSFIDSINDPNSIYHVEETVSHKKPDWYNPAQPEKLPKIIFNNDIVETERGALHFPPLVREENPLIFVDYFPKFLIDLKREGDTITLHGQLPDKGKTAVLTLGSKEATVDGQPFTLSGAPQEIEGRLYLPYELLHECNGVLVRWDAKKNILWVDTRFLRRP